MKKTILALAVVLTLILGVFAFSVFGEESDGSTVVFAPYTDADGLRQYCACGNKFVADENGNVLVGGFLLSGNILLLICCCLFIKLQNRRILGNQICQ